MCRPCCRHEVGHRPVPGPPPLARGTPEPPPGPVRQQRTTPDPAGNTGGCSRSVGQWPDHPRSRGEHLGVCPDGFRTGGPPPLARGTRWLKCSAPHRCRTTPARAGNTGSPGSTPPRRSDHPRSRREHSVRVGQHPDDRGPPPLAQGTQIIVRWACPGSRTTPARAGNTWRCCTGSTAPPDHPRSRGEHWRSGGEGPQKIGPPPLARGAHRCSCPRRGRRRTTPARAGSTEPHAPGCTPTPDHPRSRGEHVRDGHDEGPVRGPPPLARGAQDPEGTGVEERRTTPARAGSTPRARSSAEPRTDHPRSRGEHRGQLDMVVIDYGPPPLARRAPRRRLRAHAERRTTPARAGSTCGFVFERRTVTDHPRSRGDAVPGRAYIGPPPLARGAPAPSAGRAAPRPDHPRSRGEHDEGTPSVQIGNGPPPLARGARRVPLDAPPAARTTPARAGSTG